ncbi:hypothetical protein [Natrialba asiatica]|uniref:Uncharacterized protein n=1 Tax=Natrialba asiatica (strain ATCC 700177 / DSM 12278 / JCM 9576 / FERM P-10747 / NBRC 102637 / 172P1) TaxID=29540 RepID=M0AWP3_NATA1|nr:hypothetical protein [Natrialba asiatica]ELZ02393.1 hypothetical protein C481_06981 [Natrialba asiatica DSM 12278]
MSDDAPADFDLGTILDDAEDALDELEHTLGAGDGEEGGDGDTGLSGLDDLDDLDDETLSALADNVETLSKLATEVADLLETLDLSALPEAIDANEVIAAIDAGEIPTALADDDTGVGDVVDFGHLFRAIDLLDAWDATDIGEIWETKRELEELTDDGGDGDDTLLDGLDLGGDDGGGDDLLDVDADPAELLGDIDVMDDPEAYQVAIQQTTMEGIDSFREALLETRAKLAKLHEFNREKMRRQDTSVNSRNPTAASTMPATRADVASGVKHSTVPQQVRLSTAPSRKRIYGNRFEREYEKRRQETEGDGED